MRQKSCRAPMFVQPGRHKTRDASVDNNISGSSCAVIHACPSPFQQLYRMSKRSAEILLGGQSEMQTDQQWWGVRVQDQTILPGSRWVSSKRRQWDPVILQSSRWHRRQQSQHMGGLSCCTSEWQRLSGVLRRVSPRPARPLLSGMRFSLEMRSTNEHNIKEVNHRAYQLPALTYI